MVVGYSGTGSFTQSGGTNSVAYTLSLGFNAGGSGTYNLTGSGLLSVGYPEYIGYSGSGSFTQSGGTHAVYNNLCLGYNAGSNGSYDLSGSGLLSAINEYVGYSGSGSLTQSGGTHSVANALYLEYSPGSSGTYNLSGNGLLSASYEYIGGFGTGSFTQSGGTNAVTSALYVGSGTYNLSGSGLLSAPYEYVGVNGTGSFNQSGGTNSVSVALVLAQNAGSSGTYNLNGGLLTLAGSGLIQGAGAATFNFSGGTFQAASTFSTSMPIVLATAGSNGTFDTQGNTLTLAGSLSGPGGFQEIGDGMLVLAASNGFTGTTLVSNGTLLLANTAALAGSTFDTSGAGSLSFGTLTSAAFGGLQGSGNLTLNNATPAAVDFAVGGNNSSTTFSGGLSGSGSLTKIGAAVLTITGSSALGGYLAVDGGTLAMPSGRLSAPNQYVGYSGTGNFAQSGGTNAASNSLYLGYNAGGAPGTPGRGTYNLSGSGLLTASSESIGYAGSGSFTQSGGTNTVSGVLVLGQSASSAGSYNLNGGLLVLASSGISQGLGSATFDFGGGTLGASAPWASSLNIGLTGNDGNSTLDTSGGNISLAGNLTGPGGLNKVGPGTVTLSGTNSFFSGALNIGGGTLAAPGGALSTGYLDIANGGSVQFGGGTLQISGGGLANQGHFDATGSTGTLTVTGSAIVDFSAGTLENTASMSLEIGPNSLLLVPPGFNTSVFGSYSNAGLMHTTGTTLNVSSGTGFGGTGAINDFVNCQGTIVATADGAIRLNGGVSISGTGNVNLGTGYLIVDSVSPASGITAGGLAASSEYIGFNGTGAFNQSGGSNHDDLYVGYNAGSSGSYNLNGTGLLAEQGNEFIGYSGTGTFTHSGGTNSIANNLYVGYKSTGNGSYSLSGSGQLSASNEFVGYSGIGSFTQSCGTNSVAYNLAITSISSSAQGQGSYVLNGPGLLTVGQNESIGGGGSGSFTQSAGTNSVAAECSIAASGSYTLTSGLQQASYLHLTGGQYLANGGTIQINGGLQIASGTFSGGGGTTAIVANGLVDLSGGSLLQTGSMSLSLSNSSLLILPSSGTLAAFGNFSNLGLTHTAGTTLNIAASQGFVGWGDINDPVVDQGTIAVPNNPYAGLTLHNGLVLSGSGSVNLGNINSGNSNLGNGPGSLIVNDSSSGVSGGSLITPSLVVANSGTGTFSHTGGSVAAANLYIGYNPGNSGTYSLGNSASLTAATEYVGYGGNGTFTQTGGTNTATSAVYLGNNAGSTANYNLFGGLLVASSILQGAGSGTLNITGGSLTGGTNSVTISTPIVLTTTNSNGTFITSGSSLTLAGQVSGAGGIVKTGASTLVLAANNTYTGDTIVSQGAVLLSNANAAQNSTVNVGVDNGLLFSGSGAFNVGSIGGTGNLALNNVSSNPITLVTGGNNAITTYSGVISGAGVLVHNGSGTLVLTASNTYTGGTILGPDALVVTNPAATGTGSITFAGNATILFTQSMSFSNTFVVDANTTGTIDTASYTVALTGPINGLGGLSKSDSGTLILANSNTYTGTTMVTGGVMLLANTAALAGSTFDTSGSGSLSFGTLTSAAVGGLQGSGSLALSNTASAAVTLAVGGNNANTTFAGTLSGPGGLVKAGTGLLALTGTNLDTGGLVLDPGIVSITSDAALGASTGTATWQGLTGNVIFAANSTLQASASVALAANRTIVLGPSTTATFDTNGNTFTIGGPISGSGALAVVGSGTLVLTNSNTYSGGTLVSSNGALEVATTNALPGAFTPGKVSVANGATLIFAVGTSQQWTTANINTLLSVSGLFSPGASLGFDTNGGSFSLGSIGNGSIGLTVVGGHSLTLTGSNSFSGVTNVSQGTLQLANSAALQGSTVAIDIDNGLQFAPGIDTFCLGGLSGGNLLELSDMAGSAVALTVGSNGDSTTFSGEIAGSGALIKAGDGTLVLSGSNDYLGGTTVDDGMLIATSFQALPEGTSLTVGAGGTLIFGSPLAGGTIVGGAPISAAMVSAAGPVPVPEPGTLALLAAGGLVVGFGVWRRSKKTHPYSGVQGTSVRVCRRAATSTA
jgi:autotransporter-associated beta strand protein